MLNKQFSSFFTSQIKLDSFVFRNENFSGYRSHAENKQFFELSTKLV